MTTADVPAVEAVTAESFYTLDLTTRPADWPAPEPRPAQRAESWKARIQHLVRHDPDGCWVAADDEDRVVGVAAALIREGMWGLSSFAVLPSLQVRGLGRSLLDAALRYGAPSMPGFICASHDPRAVRLYRLAGFDIYPAMLMWGQVRRTAIPALGRLRAATVDDIELLDAIDRGSRGHGHGVDHEIMLAEFQALIAEGSGGRGYVYLRGAGGPYLLAATDVDTAVDLMWASLGESEPGGEVDFHNVTQEQDWAIDVGLAAGLELHNRGFLALRAMSAPTPYLPSGHFL